PTPSPRAVRRSGGAPTIKPNSPPDRRSTRPGCERPHHPHLSPLPPLKHRKKFLISALTTINNQHYLKKSFCREAQNKINAQKEGNGLLYASESNLRDLQVPLAVP